MNDAELVREAIRREIDRLCKLVFPEERQQKINRLTALADRLDGGVIVPREFLKACQCPSCDGSGAYYDNTGQVVQCQWCDVRNTMLTASEAK